MVLVHGFYWTWTVHGRFLLPAESVWSSVFERGMFLGIFPLMLPFLAGAALRLRWSATRSYPGRNLSRLAVQCAVLAALGYAMNVFAAGWYVIWAWNVLQLVALSFLVVGLLYLNGSIWPVAFIAALILGLSDPLRQWIPSPDRSIALRVILGDPFDWHQWPVFPWMATVAFGFVLADAYAGLSRERFVRLCIASGIVMTLLAAALGRVMPVFDPMNLIGAEIMQPAAVDVLGLMGVTFLAFGALTAIQGRMRFSRHGVVGCFSGGILAIYLVHMVIGVRLHDMIFGHVIHSRVVTELWRGWHPFFMVGFPIMLLLASWGVGYIAVRWLQGKRFSVRVRKVGLTGG